ncbi:DUF2127 domain-containing protein [Comamonas sp. w2-DMI]|uniref:DUF2127 domain-containing protein n=1 Tax=Comamonas sp. w2-DMI TaxID=3126391 RepID=UPI0032E409F1
MNPSSLRTAVRSMALFEAAKGVAALLGLLGLLGLLHHDLHKLALELIGHVGLSPAQRYPALLLDMVDRLNVTPVHTLVLLGGLYAAVRFVEAWGLWRDRAWGEWFGVAASGVYIPLEVQHILRHTSWQAMLVLAFNVALVLVLLARLMQRRAQARERALP